MQRRVSKNDYARKHPDKSYQKRAISNKSKQHPQQKAKPANVKNAKAKPNTRPVDKNWKPKTKPTSKPSNSHLNKSSAKPTKRPSKKPATRPSSTPTKKPAHKTTKKPAAKPAHKAVKKSASSRPVKRGGKR